MNPFLYVTKKFQNKQPEAKKTIENLDPLHILYFPM